MARGRRRERGNVAIWTVLSLGVVGGFMALSIHGGRSYSNRGELQNGADAAALAAAAQLDGTISGIDRAEAAALAFGAAHTTENKRIAIDASADLTFGHWDRATRTFEPISGRAEGDLRRIIAVQVRDARRDLPVEFGPAFLRSGATATVSSSAVAAGGGPCDDRCAFPSAFADCMLLDESGKLRCEDRFFVLNSDWQDNLGLTSLDPARSASVSNIKDALRACVRSSADAPIPVSNGNPIQPVFTPTPAFPLEVVSPVVHADQCQQAHYEKCAASSPTSPCLNAKFVGDMRIVGYASFVVCYVTKSTVSTWPPSDWGPSAESTAEQVALWSECGAPPSHADFPDVPDGQWPGFLKQTLFIKQRCKMIEPAGRTTRGGCESFGIWTTRSRLVQ